MARRDERGAVVAMVALMAVLVLAVSALAVDLGVQRVARRDMQALADAVALDLSRLVDGRSAAAIAAGGPGVTGLDAAAQASVQRNDTTTVGSAPAVVPTLVTLDAGGRPVRTAAGEVQVVTGTAVPTAVLVTAETAVDFAFTVGRGGASRSAIGTAESGACFRLGSFAAAVSSGSSPVLNRFVNDALNLSVVGYQGLADASVTIGALAAELGAGTTDGVADVKNVKLRDLFLASARALQREGGQAADVSLLNSLSASVDGGLVTDLAELVELSSGGSAALASRFNVLDLVAGSAFVANGTNFLDLPVLYNVPQFSQGAASLQVIAGPQLACGRVGEATASTAQVRLRASPTLNIPTIAGLAGVSAPVTLDVQLASATGVLTGITCGEGTPASPESVTVQVSKALATGSLSIPIRLTGEVKASDIVARPSLFGLSNLLSSLLGVKATVDLRINAGVSLTNPASSTAATYAVPPRTYADPERVGGAGGISFPKVVIDASDITGSVQVNGNLLNLVDLNLATDLKLDAILGDLVSKNVVGGINGFIDNVNAQLTPLSSLLGLQVAGADLYGVPRPTCRNPALVG